MSKATGDNTSIVNAATVRPVTRRTILAGAAATIGIAGAAIPATALNANAETDPVVILWRQFQPAQDDVRRLEARSEEICDTFPENPGIVCGHVYAAVAPVGTVPVGRPRFAQTPNEIEELGGILLRDADPVARAAWVSDRKAELVEVNRKIEEAEHAAGLHKVLDEAERQQQSADDLYSRIVAAIPTTPAGIAATVLLAFEYVREGELLNDLPHCLHVAALRNLLPLCPPDLAARMRVFIEAERAVGFEPIRTVGDCLNHCAGIPVAPRPRNAEVVS